MKIISAIRNRTSASACARRPSRLFWQTPQHFPASWCRGTKRQHRIMGRVETNIRLDIPHSSIPPTKDAFLYYYTMSSPCIIQPNPDISGIGIRVGIYIVSYLNAFIPTGDGHYGFDRLQASLLLGAKLNGFALIITAVVQTGLHSYPIMSVKGLTGVNPMASEKSIGPISCHHDHPSVDLSRVLCGVRAVQDHTTYLLLDGVGCHRSLLCLEFIRVDYSIHIWRKSTHWLQPHSNICVFFRQCQGHSAMAQISTYCRWIQFCFRRTPGTDSTRDIFV